MKPANFIIWPSVFLLISCGISREGYRPAPVSVPSAAPAAVSAVPESGSIESAQDLLQNAHDQWKGTPYILGGSSPSGVDCSSFTQIVYRDYFNQNLPRNTREQLQEGSGIRRHHVRAGDLVFFRTSRGTLHVGIAMHGGDFLHASVSSGVMISNLSDRYWSGRYLGARRVLN